MPYSRTVCQRDSMPKEKDLPKYLENIVVMAIVWSVGGVCSGTGRKVFDDLFRETLLGTIRQDSRWPLFVAKNPSYDGDCLRDRHVIDSIPESGWSLTTSTILINGSGGMDEAKMANILFPKV